MKFTWIKYVGILLLIGISFSESFAQKRKFGYFQLFQKSEEFEEDVFLNVGFSFPYIYSNPIIKTNANQSFTKNLDPSHYIGSGISVILQPNQRIDVYSGIDFAFSLTEDESTEDESLTPVDYFHKFEVPFGLRLRSNPFYFQSNNNYNTYRLLLIAGGKFTRNFGANAMANEKKSNATTSTNFDYILFKPEYFSWEAGVGIQITTRYFRLTPQLTFTESIGNLLDQKLYNEWMAPSPSMNALQNLASRGFQIKIIIE